MNMDALSNIAGAISRRRSGKKSSGSVAKDAIQDGGQNDHSQKEQLQNSETPKNYIQGEHKTSKYDDSKCASCNKAWDSFKTKGTYTLLECSFCKEWSCMNSADVRKGDMYVVTRQDVFWACKTYTPQVPKLIAQAMSNENETESVSSNNEHSIKDTIVKSLSEIENRLEAKIDAELEATVKQITATINPIQQQVSETVAKSVSQNVTKMWSDTLFGGIEQSVEDFPDLNDPRSKEDPIKPKMTLKKSIKEVATEQKKYLDRDNTLKNIVIHRAPEPQNPSAKERDDHEVLVKDMLKAIEVNVKPAKIFRLGEYKETDQEGSSPRPLKVIFENHFAQQEVINSANKLQNAKDQLKQLSVGYDLSESERNTIKLQVQEAKEK